MWLPDWRRGPGLRAVGSRLHCPASSARTSPCQVGRSQPGPAPRAPRVRAGSVPSRPRGFILSVSCLCAVLSSRCWARLCRRSRVGAHWKPGLGCRNPWAGWLLPALLLRCNPSIPEDHAPGARFRSVRWWLGKRVPASAPARVPKVVFSFLLFSIPNYPRWSARVYFSSHELGQRGHRSGRHGHDLIASKRHIITDPGAWRARGPLEDPAAPFQGRFPGLGSPPAWASGFCWRFAIPPNFSLPFYVFIFIWRNNEKCRVAVPPVSSGGRIVRTLKKGL